MLQSTYENKNLGVMLMSKKKHNKKKGNNKKYNKKVISDKVINVDMSPSRKLTVSESTKELIDQKIITIEDTKINTTTKKKINTILNKLKKITYDKAKQIQKEHKVINLIVSIFITGFVLSCVGMFLPTNIKCATDFEKEINGYTAKRQLVNDTGEKVYNNKQPVYVYIHEPGNTILYNNVIFKNLCKNNIVKVIIGFLLALILGIISQYTGVLVWIVLIIIAYIIIFFIKLAIKVNTFVHRDPYITYRGKNKHNNINLKSQNKLKKEKTKCQKKE